MPVVDICQRLQASRRRLSSAAAGRTSWAASPALYLVRTNWLSPTAPLFVAAAAYRGVAAAAALAFIRRHEPANGMPAPQVIFHWRKASFAVLRSAKSKTHLRPAPGPAVSGFDPQQEWQEIENKAAGLRTLLSERRETTYIKRRNSALDHFLASIFDTGQFHVSKAHLTDAGR